MLSIQRENLVAQKAVASSPLNFGRIAKPLRGGGGTSAVAPVPPPPSGPSANPIARLQNEEGCVVIAFLLVEILTAMH